MSIRTTVSHQFMNNGAADVGIGEMLGGIWFPARSPGNDSMRWSFHIQNPWHFFYPERSIRPGVWRRSQRSGLHRPLLICCCDVHKDPATIGVFSRERSFVLSIHSDGNDQLIKQAGGPVYQIVMANGDGIKRPGNTAILLFMAFQIYTEYGGAVVRFIFRFGCSSK